MILFSYHFSLIIFPCCCCHSFNPPLKGIYIIGTTYDHFSQNFEIHETAQLLNEEIRSSFEYPVMFQVLRVSADKSSQMLSSRQIDFIFTDPDRLVCNINVADDLIPLASMVQNYLDHEADDNDAVIIVRNDSTLSSITDLAQASISLPALYESITLTLWHALANVNIRLLHDPRQLIIRPDDPQQIILDVVNGVADAGFLPSQALHSLVSQGLSDPRSFKLLTGPDGGSAFAPHGTRRQGWILAAAGGAVADAVQRAVLAALLRIDSRHPAAVADRYTAWLPPPPLIAQRSGPSLHSSSSTERLFYSVSTIVAVGAHDLRHTDAIKI
jgi:ABC-type amino acid transport substrate-binding protein